MVFAICNASTQKEGESLAWNKSVRTTSFVVRIGRSMRPFWGEVYGHERRREMPWEEKNPRSVVVKNSPPLSHCMQRIMVRNWVATKVMNRSKVSYVSDFARRRKAHE
jgi:hypothetical protein